MLTSAHKEALDADIAAYLAAGMEQVLRAEFVRRWRAAGFRFDLANTTKDFGRWIAGPRAGQLSPDCNMYPVHIATRLSPYHFQAPEDVRAAARQLRNTIFAVTRDGYIMQV